MRRTTHVMNALILHKAKAIPAIAKSNMTVVSITGAMPAMLPQQKARH